MSDPVHFPILSAQAAAAARHVFRQRKPFETKFGEDSLSLTLDPDASPTNPTYIRLRARDVTFGLEIENTTFDALFESHGGMSTKQVFCDDRVLQAEIALCGFLELVEAACGESIELLEVAEGPLQGTVSLSGWIRLHSDSAFCIDLPESLLDTTCQLMDAWPTAPVPPPVPVSCPLIVAGVYVSPRLLAEILPGDFLPLSTWRPLESPVRLRFPYGPPVMAQVASGQLTILQPTGDEAMSDSCEAADLSELPAANVFVEMGHVQIPLDELQLIAPGYVLDLQLPPNGPITVTANGRAFATGTLVDVAGTLGVRIEQLLTDV